MASQALPNGPSRRITQIHSTASVLDTKSKAPPADALARGASLFYPTDSPSHVQTSRTPSRVSSSAAPSQSHQPSVRPSQAPSHQPSMRPSQAATLRGPSQSAFHQPSVRPSQAAILRGASRAPPSYASIRGPSQYVSAASQMPGREPSMRANAATELRRDAASNYQTSRQPTIVLQSPSNHNVTLLQRDAATITQRPSAHHTLLQRDQSKMPSVMSAIKEASVAPVIGPSKKFENAPSVRSILHSPQDIQMASRQITINEMQGPEREVQEEWALGKLGELTTGCPQNYGWSRIGDGYICDGGSHYITDDLLAEGMGGMFVVKNKHDWQNRSEGPYYSAGKNEQGKNLFMKIAATETG